MGGSNGALSSREEALRAIRERTSASASPRTSGPTATRSARWPAMQQVLTALGKDAVAFLPADGVPAPVRVPLHRARGPGHRAAGRPRRAHAGVPGLRQHRPHAAGSAQARAAHADGQHRPPPRQHALRGDQPRRPARVVHGGDGVGPDARRSACAITQAIGEALYVGLVTDTGRFMYENTGPRAHEMAAELIAGGHRRRTRSTASSTRASRRASSSCWRAGSPTSSASTTAC